MAAGLWLVEKDDGNSAVNDHHPWKIRQVYNLDQCSRIVKFIIMYIYIHIQCMNINIIYIQCILYNINN